jgi:hypothetical protein
MDISAWTALIGVALGSGGFSALGGYLLSGRNERKRDERAAGREREALREKQAEEARTFQRDTLLELHDLLYKINRTTGRSIAADSQRHSETGRYGRDSLPDDLSGQFSELIAGINRLRVRIFDAELRDLTQRYTATLITALNPAMGHGYRRYDGDDDRERYQAQHEMMGSTRLWAQLEEKLGAAIRAQFPGSDVAPVVGQDPGPKAAVLTELHPRSPAA